MINSTLNWNWTQSNFSAGQGDAVSVQEHEISEVLGRSMGGGKAGCTPMDFDDYSAAGNPVVGSPAAAAVTIGSAAGTRFLNVPAAASPPQTYFSAGGTTVGLAFTGPASSNDIADWNSTLVPNDSLGSSPDRVASPISANDVLVMNVLGLASAAAPACFLRGTLVATPSGAAPIETLRPGDMIRSLAGVTRPISWVGFGRTLMTPRNRCDASPVIFCVGALGTDSAGLPTPIRIFWSMAAGLRVAAATGRYGISICRVARSRSPLPRVVPSRRPMGKTPTCDGSAWRRRRSHCGVIIWAARLIWRRPTLSTAGIRRSMGIAGPRALRCCRLTSVPGLVAQPR